MNRNLLILLLLLPLILSGCIFNRDGKIYSVKNFLTVREQFVNQSVKLKGLILYKNECSSEPCPKYFMFNDDMDGPVANRIIVNFPVENKEDYNSLPIAKEVIISAQYYKKDQVPNVIANDNGYYVLNYLLEK
jgi:hypothetical protein